MHCFVSCGNTFHGHSDTSVSLEVFQNAVVKRHEMELSGHAYVKAELYEDDFKPLTD